MGNAIATNCPIFWICRSVDAAETMARRRSLQAEVTGDVKMTALLVLFLTLLASVAAGLVRAADDPLGDVTRSYGSAAYEETLLTLDRLDYQKFGATVDEYRALCFLALNRDAEAERAMESLIRRHPQPLDDLSLRSPKFAELYVLGAKAAHSLGRDCGLPTWQDEPRTPRLRAGG